jgi:hypothetical protein
MWETPTLELMRKLRMMMRPIERNMSEEVDKPDEERGDSPNEER